jgi:hypothetical protein
MAYPQAYDGIQKLVVQISRNHILDVEDVIPIVQRALNAVNTNIQRNLGKSK